MTLWRLVAREIMLRKLGFALGVVSVVIAVGAVVAELTLLRLHDLRTTEILAAKQAATEAEMKRMEDDYRKIMKKLGFNLLLLPAGQNLGDFHATGFAERDMPEEYVTRLANSGIMTIRHLLPSLEAKVRWPERGQRTIILAGTRGEVPITHRKPKEPMMVAVPPGSAVLGHEIWDSLSLKVGDTFTLLGREFRVAACHPERGSRDDVTIWIDLATAQQLLGKPGRINAILALKCHCAGGELPDLRKQIGNILPGVQITELSEKIVTRAEARDRAKATAQAAIAAEREHRARMRAGMERFAAWLTPAVVLGAAAWIGLLALANVRERRSEIGILRAIGLRSRQVLIVFLTRSLLIGVAGAAIGCAVGLGVGIASGDKLSGATSVAASTLDPQIVIGILIAAPLLAMLAGAAPAVIAARHDPADILRSD